MVDRYTKIVLSLIACSLVYLCVVFTPLPSAFAQQATLRPGEPSGPLEVVVVGWKPLAGLNSFPVSIVHPVQVTATQPLPIVGAVTTERSSSFLADRVVVVGWEQNSTREKPVPMRAISTKEPGLPVRVIP